ncbi:hypothetical protein BU15DRAFT_56383 [Melanogaster broomeanus]|nr:hypothetical protein BU15DRAFT_56383 [Melanogaster broomeanus]
MAADEFGAASGDDGTTSNTSHDPLRAVLKVLAEDKESQCHEKVKTSSKNSPELSRPSRSEKPACGTLFTAIQRHMGGGTIVIVDSLNYIKGFGLRLYGAYPD